MPTYNNELDGLNESKFSLPSICLIPEIRCYIRPGVVRDALRDLEMIRSAGVAGLEPAFELLTSHRLPQTCGSVKKKYKYGGGSHEKVFYCRGGT
jgi:hypothetical protein